MTTITNWSFATCSCPSWSANADESALRSSLANLDACNSSLHWWFRFWALLVVLGVVLELVFVVWEYLEERHDLRRCIMHPPIRPNIGLFVFGFLGAGLVAAGVSGELWKESQIATIETCIRKGNDTLFLLLSREAGNAQKSAEKAGAAAERAQAVANAVQAKARIQGPRWELLEENRAYFVASLKPFAPRQRIVLAKCGAEDGEMKRLYEDLFALLTHGSPLHKDSANWAVRVATKPCGYVPTRGSSGIGLIIFKTSNDKRGGEALHKTLDAIGIVNSKIEASPLQYRDPQSTWNIFGPGQEFAQWVEEDSSGVLLLIGQNPGADLKEPRSQTKAPHK